MMRRGDLHGLGIEPQRVSVGRSLSAVAARVSGRLPGQNGPMAV
jgi:hypothetical protein